MSSSDDGNMLMASTPAEPEDESVEDGSELRWESVKKRVAAELKELTLLWQVGVGKRNQAHQSGIYCWDDPKATPSAVGVSGPTTGPTLAQLLTVNVAGGPLLLPERIEQTRDEWHETPGLEFYVDFEFCSDLNDDFANLPEKGGAAAYLYDWLRPPGKRGMAVQAVHYRQPDRGGRAAHHPGMG